jgi:hypothetical protein
MQVRADITALQGEMHFVQALCSDHEGVWDESIFWIAILYKFTLLDPNIEKVDRSSFYD